MTNKDFFVALDLLEKEKNIKKEYFIESLEAALTSAYKKTYGEAKSATVKLCPEKNTIKVFSYKTIVELVEDEDKEISLEDAQQIKKSYKVGETIQTEENPKDFGRIAAQTARQVVLQRIREAERTIAISELEDKEGEIITAVVRRLDEKDNVYLETGLNQAEGILMVKDQIPGEKYTVGAKIKVYIRKVKDDFRGLQLQASRSNAEFVKKLFELEVPEIEAGEITIKSAAREAGYRTKIAVYAEDPNLDPIGACVGTKGMRVNAVVDELNGEKIDIIPYSDNIDEFIAASISPARAISITIDETMRTAYVIVAKDKLSLAIGKAGLNVRLAAKLTGWKIDVKAEQDDTNLFNIENIIVNNKEIKNIDVDLSQDEKVTDIFGDLN